MSTNRDKLTIPPELDAEMTPAVRAFVLALFEQIKSLKDEVSELKRRLGQNPSNSSLPPSSQHPHAKPQPKPTKSKRKPGGQPGHPKHERTLVPPEQVDETIGTQSESGSRFVETLLTVIETCRQQDRDVQTFVTQAIKSHWTGQPPPSLLPGA